MRYIIRMCTNYSSISATQYMNGTKYANCLRLFMNFIFWEYYYIVGSVTKILVIQIQSLEGTCSYGTLNANLEWAIIWAVNVFGPTELKLWPFKDA